MTTPSLPIEDQVKLWRSFDSSELGVKLKNQAILSKVIEPARIHYYLACQDFITQDPDTLRVKEKAMILSTRPEPVLVQGESGTGKELLARILHGERPGTFVAVNVCAVTDTLFESELFGHVKGAFTGADRERAGLIRQADNGTLFLDEIGDMDLHIQAKILRVIQHRTFRKVGGNIDEPVQCRILAATHRNLQQMIRDKTFRLDLYERLQVFSLRIKPLVERLDDIPLYAGEEFSKKLFTNYNNDDMTFSGNVRQLMNLKLRWETFGDEELVEEAVI